VCAQGQGHRSHAYLLGPLPGASSAWHAVVRQMFSWNAALDNLNHALTLDLPLPGLAATFPVSSHHGGGHQQRCAPSQHHPNVHLHHQAHDVDSRAQAPGLGRRGVSAASLVASLSPWCSAPPPAVFPLENRGLPHLPGLATHPVPRRPSFFHPRVLPAGGTGSSDPFSGDPHTLNFEVTPWSLACFLRPPGACVSALPAP
jgi:hypothetical protein